MRKYKLISALAEETAKEVVRNEENWRRWVDLPGTSEHQLGIAVEAVLKYCFRTVQISVQGTAFNLCPKTGCNRLCFHRDME